jgi:tetratricopeptide (TPR) repeat protein
MAGKVVSIAKRSAGLPWVSSSPCHEFRREPAVFGSKLSIAWARFRGVARNAWRQYKSSFSRGRAPLSTPWINNGFAKYRTRDLDGAINDFSVAIRLDPLSANAYAHRGNAFAKKGEIDDALRDFNAAIRIDPRFAVAYANRGAIWIRKHEYDKANDDFAEAIRMNPKVAIAYLGRGISSTVREDFDSVVADCMEAISLDPVCSDAYATRANAWINKNEFDKAISDFTQVLRLVPQSVVSYTGRGCARAKKGEFETAINDLTEAIRIDPRFVEAHNNLGWIYASSADARFRDGAKALEHAQLACDLSGYKKWFAVRNLAAAYAELGHFTDAIELQEKANAITPKESDKLEGERRLALYKVRQPYRATHSAS